MKIRKMAYCAVGICTALSLWGCGNQGTANNATMNDTAANNMAAGNEAMTAPTTSETAASTPAMTNATTKAVAVLHPTKGSKVQGTVTFTKETDGVRVVADVSGLKPGKHGFHVHESGDCSSPDAKSAGGHFNPTNMPHGAPDDAQRHVGDLGNLTADQSGKAHYERLDKVITLEGANSIVGRGVIVHSGADDLKSQPSGDAGERQACGVIGIAK